MMETVISVSYTHLDVYKRQEKESSFYGAVYVSTLPSYPISTTAQQTDTYRYGDRSAEICFDEKTGWVNEISLRIEKGEIEKLLPKFLYVLAPETALSDEEIQELLAYLKEEEDSAYICLLYTSSIKVYRAWYEGSGHVYRIRMYPDQSAEIVSGT